MTRFHLIINIVDGSCKRIRLPPNDHVNVKKKGISLRKDPFQLAKLV